MRPAEEDVARSLRQTLPHNDALAAIREHTREAGFDRHLTKHIDSERLPQLLRDFLARRPA